jgi:hypothetical protein
MAFSLIGCVEYIALPALFKSETAAEWLFGIAMVVGGGIRMWRESSWRDLPRGRKPTATEFSKYPTMAGVV